MDAHQAGEKVFEGAEYDYHIQIQWFGIRLKWRSKVPTYNPPSEFTDIQITGPYTRWEHAHRFKGKGGKTLMSDAVVYRLPFSFLGRIVHGLLVKKQLEDIFCYRALKIMELLKKLKE